ncbi:MAG: lysophospholipid acyltransferase family protein, partial [Quisquiliibacterium sp.]
TLVARTGTLFIERGRRHAVHRMIERMQHQLLAAGRVAVFAEGTTSDGASLLPFHANLLQAAVHANAPVVPLGLRYRDARGERASAVEYVGDTSFMASLWRIIGATSLSCEVHALGPLAPEQSLTRHQLAQQARAAIAAALELPLQEHIPDNLRALTGRQPVSAGQVSAPARTQSADNADRRA